MKCSKKVKKIFPEAEIVPDVVNGTQAFQIITGYGASVIELSRPQPTKKSAWKEALTFKPSFGDSIRECV